MKTSPAIAHLSTRGYMSFFSYQDEASREKSLSGWLDTARQMDHVARLERCEVRKPAFVTPNRSEAITGVRAFDDQCQGIMTGNVIANTFYSSYIRPRREVDCNGYAFPYGNLQLFDLRPFEQEGSLASHNAAFFVRSYAQAEDTPLLLTTVFHWRRQDGQRHRVDHGAVLTTAGLELVRTFDRAELGLKNQASSRQIMDAVTPQLCDQCLINRETVFSKPGVH